MTQHQHQSDACKGISSVRVTVGVLLVMEYEAMQRNLEIVHGLKDAKVVYTRVSPGRLYIVGEDGR